MRIDRVIYLATIACVTVNRALIVFDNYQRMKERRDRKKEYTQFEEDEDEASSGNQYINGD